jgi:hypothetical protein
VGNESGNGNLKTDGGQVLIDLQEIEFLSTRIWNMRAVVASATGGGIGDRWSRWEEEFDSVTMRLQIDTPLYASPILKWHRLGPHPHLGCCWAFLLATRGLV